MVYIVLYSWIEFSGKYPLLIGRDSVTPVNDMTSSEKHWLPHCFLPNFTQTGSRPKNVYWIFTQCGFKSFGLKLLLSFLHNLRHHFRLDEAEMLQKKSLN